MTSLSKGGNAPLTAAQVVVTVDVAAPADLSALLVTDNGKVRSDADFVFYNQPQGPGVRCVPPAGGQGWRVEIDTSAVPADVHAVRIVTSLDGDGLRFGSYPAPVAQVRDAGGTPLVDFPITGLGPESILVAVELYRRANAWKVRAVGQGYAGGLADLITDHGVSVDDAPAPPAAAAPPVAPPPTPPAPGFSQPPTAAPAPATPQYGGPAPSVPQYGGPPPSAPQYGGPSPAPGYPAPSAPSYGGPPPAAPQYGGPPPPAPGFGAPPPAPGFGSPPGPPPNQPPAGHGAPAGEVSLTKARPVSLTKGQKVTLVKDGGVRLTVIRMGLGWDPVKRGGLFGRREVQIDLDASAILMADAEPVDVAFYNNLRTRDGSIQHMGDNRTGEGEGDDEVILIDLTRVPVHVTQLFFVVTSYEGHTFENVVNAFVRLVDHTTGTELARYALQGGMPFTGLVMARVYRQGGDWKLQAIGEGIQAKFPSEALPHLVRAAAQMG